MASIPISFPPSAAPRNSHASSSRRPGSGSHPSRRPPANGVHKKRQESRMPYRPKGPGGSHRSNEQTAQSRQNRNAKKSELQDKIARLQRELHVLEQQDSADADNDNTSFPHATRFWPDDEDAKPQDLFAHSIRDLSIYYAMHDMQPPPRMACYDDPDDSILIYTSASCLNQHTSTGPRSAASACLFGPTGHSSSEPRSVALRLERKGPTGQEHPQEAHRAQLRAAIAALQCRDWRAEGWSGITIASDSEYLVEGITNWVEVWQRNGWRTSRDTSNSYPYYDKSGATANKDMWQLMLSLVIEHQRKGVEVKFWLIPHEQNAEAHAVARMAAGSLDPVEKFSRKTYAADTIKRERYESPEEVCEDGVRFGGVWYRM